MFQGTVSVKLEKNQNLRLYLTSETGVHECKIKLTLKGPIMEGS